MRTIILTLLAIISIVGSVFSQTKSLEKFLPPGTVKVNDSLFYDITETTNYEWLKYTEWLKNKYGIDGEIYKNALNDTLLWAENFSYGEPYMDCYHIHPAYREYPVLGVSFEQASDYCLWRTERVKETLLELKDKKPKTYIPNKFIYRLPTILEWETEAKVDYSEKIKHKLEHKYKEWIRYNFKILDYKFSFDNKDLNYHIRRTAPVKSYWPNKNGIYNLFGNVAEMTLEKGIAKGGGWIHLYDEVKIETEFKYIKPTNWLGFRCVCEIIEE